jgi:hypothetical protein
VIENLPVRVPHAVAQEPVVHLHIWEAAHLRPDWARATSLITPIRQESHAPSLTAPGAIRARVREAPEPKRPPKRPLRSLAVRRTRPSGSAEPPAHDVQGHRDDGQDHEDVDQHDERSFRLSSRVGMAGRPRGAGTVSAPFDCLPLHHDLPLVAQRTDQEAGVRRPRRKLGRSLAIVPPAGFTAEWRIPMAGRFRRRRRVVEERSWDCLTRFGRGTVA